MTDLEQLQQKIEEFNKKYPNSLFLENYNRKRIF